MNFLLDLGALDLAKIRYYRRSKNPPPQHAHLPNRERATLFTR
jgi:hypothetical protein